MVPLARRVTERYPQVRAIVVDALPVHDAGGTDAQELGCSLAAGVAYLRELDRRRARAWTRPPRLLEFRYAATADQFPTIAKLRAARRLWARVAEACGAPAPRRSGQHAVTSPAMMTRRDPWVNMLRATVAGFAAGVGGADAVTVLPFDDAPRACRTRSPGGSPATPQSLLVRSRTWPGSSTRPAAPGTSRRSPTSWPAPAWAWFQEIEARRRAGGRARAGWSPSGSPADLGGARAGGWPPGGNR